MARSTSFSGTCRGWGEARGKKRLGIGAEQKLQGDDNQKVTHQGKNPGDKPLRAKRSEGKKSYGKKPRVKTGPKAEGKKRQLKAEGKKSSKRTKRATLTLKGVAK